MPLSKCKQQCKRIRPESGHDLRTPCAGNREPASWVEPGTYGSEECEAPSRVSMISFNSHMFRVIEHH